MSDQRPSSSPLSSLPSSQPLSQVRLPNSDAVYRAAHPLPYELLQHVQVYFEEQLLNQAFRFLLSLLTSSLSNTRPVFVPPPIYLGVIATLCIHPTLTTRTTARDKQTNANSALKYLRLVNRTVGPVNAQFLGAFEFRKYNDGLVMVADAEEDDEDTIHEKLNISYADTDSVFYLAEDFWALVGWALNSSCLSDAYAARWEYYAPYLDYVLDVLEADWSAHEITDDLQNSLIWLYVKNSTGGNVRGRRILRAIFTDGSESALNEFREIFRKELKTAKTDVYKIKKQEVVVVDVDEEIYGDWMQGDESTSEEDINSLNDIRLNGIHERQSKRLRTRTPLTRRRLTPKPSKKLLAMKNTDHDDSDVSMSDNVVGHCSLGGLDSIAIRLRLLSLLIDVSRWTQSLQSLDDTIFPDLQELYTLFVEFIRPLPLNVFQQFVIPLRVITDPSKPVLSPEKRNILCEFLLQRLTDRGSQKRIAFEAITPARLITDYLPFAAFRASAEAQAKFSLLLEILVRHLAKDASVSFKRSPALMHAFDTGVTIRNIKAEDAGEGRKKLSAIEEDSARLVLAESVTRMKLVVNSLEESLM